METLNDQLVAQREAKSVSGRLTVVRDRIVSQLRGAADKVYHSDDQYDAPNGTSAIGAVDAVGSQTSAILNAAADRIERIDPAKIKRDVTVQVRLRPGSSLLIAGAAGFILSSMLRRR